MGGRGGKRREGNSDEGVGGVWGWMARTQRSIAENGEGIRRNELRRDNVMSFLANEMSNKRLFEHPVSKSSFEYENVTTNRITYWKTLE